MAVETLKQNSGFTFVINGEPSLISLRLLEQPVHRFRASWPTIEDPVRILSQVRRSCLLLTEDLGQGTKDPVTKLSEYVSGLENSAGGVVELSFKGTEPTPHLLPLRLFLNSDEFRREFPHLADVDIFSFRIVAYLGYVYGSSDENLSLGELTVIGLSNLSHEVARIYAETGPFTLNKSTETELFVATSNIIGPFLNDPIDV